MREKKGLSAIVATVLIILVSVVGVAIIWAVVIPMFSDVGFDNFGGGLEIITDGGYTYCDDDSGVLSIRVKRDFTESDLKNLIFLVIIQGNSVSYSNDKNGDPWVVPALGETRVYKLNVSKFINDGCELISSVSVIPVFADGRQGASSTTENFWKGGWSGGDDVANADCDNDLDCDDANECTADSCSTAGVCVNLASTEFDCVCAVLNGVVEGSYCLGEELVANGGFDSYMSGWDTLPNSNWFFDPANKRVAWNDLTQDSTIKQDITLVDNTEYWVVFNLSNNYVDSKTGLYVTLGGGASSQFNVFADGIQSYSMISGSGASIEFEVVIIGVNPGDIWSVDDVSVREILV